MQITGHLTAVFLRRYRDAIYSLKVVVHQMETQFQNNQMLDSSVDLLRTNHKHGEQYHWLLYYTFLSPQKLKGMNEIIEALRPPAKETVDILNEFFPEE